MQKDFKIIGCPWTITIHPIHHQEIYSTFNVICSYSWTFIHVQRFRKLLGSTEAWNEQKSFFRCRFWNINLKCGRIVSKSIHYLCHVVLYKFLTYLSYLLKKNKSCNHGENDLTYIKMQITFILLSQVGNNCYLFVVLFFYNYVTT